ncbi:AraC family transcriptional regulator [Chitinophaga silvatica]|uniref:AraC family transcriptional regulator n=1 Tax=Chitinophaga silvatica TaxID=2282649 RepID=A0A3E1Y884_9BACT|nr:AraC family transcriptional regulator [Chitinophaga silvatica]RFS21324.1 AraC family transcriptional regulator [Chitinophaga silvatica]
MQHPKAAMYLGSTRSMLISPHLVTDIHQHAVIQFTCSLDRKPFIVWTENDGWQEAEAVLINSGIEHSLKEFNGWQVTTCIMPDVQLGRLVQEKVLEGKPIKYFPEKDILPVIEALQMTRQQLITDSNIFNSLTNTVYHHLLQEVPFSPPLDDRIKKVIDLIRQNIHNKVSAAALASAIHLSENRFLHLFREQVGAPLRQYVLWQRVAMATQNLMEGKSSKEAAYEAGFADQAHFSRTFFQLFGAQPSAYAAFKPLYHFGFFYNI